MYSKIGVRVHTRCVGRSGEVDDVRLSVVWASSVCNRNITYVEGTVRLGSICDAQFGGKFSATPSR